MTSMWSGTIGEWKQLAKSGTLLPQLIEGYSSVYKRPSPAELTAWEQSLPALLAVLGGAEFDLIQVILELQMPIGGERADVVLLGGGPAEPKALILELKQWSRATLDPSTLEVMVPGIGLHQHPSTQALNYRGKLQLFHSRAASYDLRAAVYLHNMTKMEKTGLTGNSVSDLVRDAPLFSGEEEEALAETVKMHLLPSGLPADEHRSFDEAPYEQTRHLFDVLARHASDIANNEKRPSV